MQLLVGKVPCLTISYIEIDVSFFFFDKYIETDVNWFPKTQAPHNEFHVNLLKSSTLEDLQKLKQT